MADLATLQTELAEVNTAIHRLIVGSRVDRNESPDGSFVQYAGVRLAELREHKADLEGQIREVQGLPSNAPVYITF